MRGATNHRSYLLERCLWKFYTSSRMLATRFSVTKRAWSPRTLSPILQADFMNHDPLISDWYWTGQVTFDALSFEDFMKEVRNQWLANDWEQDVCRKVLGMKQSGSFWEWAMKMRSWNTLLWGTSAHLDDAGLLNQLEANLEPWLSRACDDERIKEADLDKWLDKVKIVDEKKHRERQQQRADVEEAACSHLKQNMTSAGLSEPSRRYNTFQGPASDRSSTKGKENASKLPTLKGRSYLTMKDVSNVGASSSK